MMTGRPSYICMASALMISPLNLVASSTASWELVASAELWWRLEETIEAHIRLAGACRAENDDERLHLCRSDGVQQGAAVTEDKTEPHLSKKKRHRLGYCSRRIVSQSFFGQGASRDADLPQCLTRLGVNVNFVGEQRLGVLKLGIQSQGARITPMPSLADPLGQSRGACGPLEIWTHH